MFRKIQIIIFSFFLISLSVYFIYGFKDQCKTFRTLNAIKDFGWRHSVNCFYFGKALGGRFKNEIKKNSFFYNTLLNLDKKIKNNRVRIDSINKLNRSFESTFQEPKKLKVSGIYNNDEKLINNKKIILSKNTEYNSWLRSHGGNWNTHFSNSKKINLSNIEDLQLIWKHQTILKKEIKKKWKQNIQINPVYFDNKLFYVSSDWKLYALDAKSGKVIWEKECLFQPSRRGIVVSKEKTANYIYIPIGSKIYKIKTNDGTLEKEFNEGRGYVWSATSITAPMIFKNKLIVANVGAEPSINIFNKTNGKFINKVRLHPESQNFGGGTPWGGVAIDAELGIVYLNTGNPLPGTFGVHRPGSNKNSNSVIAIGIDEEKILWTFQETSHDLWNFDIPSPPILHNLRINDKEHKVVISVTKRGNTIILDRITGKNIFDYKLKKAPKSKIIGEFTAPYQKFFDKPERFSKIEFTQKDFDKLPLIKKKQIQDKLIDSEIGWMVPPSFGKSVVMHGLHGGAQWMGAALDPLYQDLFIPVISTPYIYQNFMISSEISQFVNDAFNKELNFYNDKCAACHGKMRNGQYDIKKDIAYKYNPSLVGLTLQEESRRRLKFNNFLRKHSDFIIKKEDYKNLTKLFEHWDKNIFDNNLIQASNYIFYEFLTKDNLPASNPPWGYIAKINLVSGKIEWKKPIGILDNQNVGTVGFGGIALNSGNIIFYTGTEDKRAYAIDKFTGKILWSFEMEASGTAPPLIYEIDNKQYISFLSTGGGAANFKDKGSTLYTFSIK